MDTKALREEFATLRTQAGQVLTTAAEAKRELTPEEKEANTKRFARMDSIKQQVDDAKRLAEFALVNGDAELPKEPTGKVEFDSEQSGKVTFDKDQYRAAVNHFCRTGDASKVEKFTITASTGGGVFIPKEILPATTIRRQTNAFRAFLDFYGLAPISRQFTQGISLPVVDDTANIGQQQSQSATSGTLADPDSSGSLTLNATLYSSKQTWIANTVVNAVDFDVFAWVQPLLQRRLDKAQESAWTTTLKGLTTSTKTTASPTTFTYAEWLAFESTLPVSYRDDGGFIVSDGTYQTLRGLVDNNNRPIVDLDPANNWQTTMHGKPLIVSEYMETVAASHTIAAFVSASAMFILDAGPQRIARYVLQPSFPDQTGFELFQNGDCGFVPSGVALLKTHA